MAENLNLSPLFTWRSAISSPDHDLPQLVRHVALVLSQHMNERGASCFPSIATVAGEVGCSDRAVQKAIGCLKEAGWLIVNVGGMRGGKRVTSTYQATFPESILELQETDAGGVNVVHLSGRGRVNVTTSRGERGSGKDVKRTTKTGDAHANQPNQPSPADLERLNRWLLTLGVGYADDRSVFAEELGKVAPWIEATEAEDLREECKRKAEVLEDEEPAA